MWGSKRIRRYNCDNDDDDDDDNDDDDDGDGDGDDGDDGDDDDDERKLMMWMLRRRRRRRNMMMLRKTDPKTGKQTLCEPAQSKCTWTCHKSHFVQKSGKLPDPNSATHVLCEPARSNRAWRFEKSHYFVWKFTGKLPHAPATTSIEHRAFTVTVRTPQCGHTVSETKI